MTAANSLTPSKPALTLRSVFETEKLFTEYKVELQFREWYIGGTPKDPEVLESWLRTKTLVTQEEELAQMMARTLREQGYEIEEDLTYEEVSEVVKTLAGEKRTNGFKFDDEGIYIEDRTIKAALKECINILYAGTPMGKTRKGAKNFLAERVFVNPSRIRFLDEHDKVIREPHGKTRFIGHVTGPQGPRSSLTYHEYVEQGIIRFTVRVTDDAIPHDYWPRIWRQMEENGLGSLRSQSFGRFVVTDWQKIS